MTEHTKEPWAHRNGRIYQADHDVLTIANIARAWDGDYSEANARRIVAAVNACAGLQTEYLEKGGLPEFSGKALCADTVQQELDHVTAQRDQLLAALEHVRNAGDWYTSAIELNMDIDGNELLEVVDKAIAAVKGD